jgi:deoxyribodipyrimidine photo-lyase
VAGVGNDPRENRYFNVAGQAKKYDEKGEFVRLWLGENQ